MGDGSATSTCGGLREGGLHHPGPGGVGPMTVAMLLENTVLAAARQHGVLDVASAVG